MLEPIPLSALQHFVYCPRQCALIHVEQSWSENAFTTRGTLAHERADSGERELLEGVRVLRGLSLYSDRLGLIGRGDVVELLRDGTPFPVEYKSGAKKKPILGSDGLNLLTLADDVQLCAQALCLEEMLSRPVPRGAVYHIKSRRRRDVEFTLALRDKTLEVILITHTLLESRDLPEPVNDARCPNCSLIETCMPDAPKRTANPFEPLEDT
ncbi:MAG: CRISPR-associated protein Cas4 [Pleurocapsa sp. SU_196_0]|nr:CRISPR-associated protein Cas4 [Pleurocapsa sp. SU_196_0]